ncbi:MAG: excinuclease ABC subunit UvrC [Opitutales bacterium]
MEEKEPVDLKTKVRRLPHKPGVYLMKDRFGQVLYVGKAKDLKKRVSTYFQPSRRYTVAQPKVQAMVALIHTFDTILVRSEAEALLLEGKLIKEYKPRYNTVFTDDKRFLLVRIDRSGKLPRFRFSRNRREDGSVYFGPFAQSGMVRKTLHQMRRKFGILLSDTHPIEVEPGVFKLYDDVRGEIYGHPNLVTREDYLERVEEASTFLEGKSREWLSELEKAMFEAAEKQDFEKAAELRDAVNALKATISKTRKFTRNHPDKLEELGNASERLTEALGLRRTPQQIECFDISHISGSFTVASMVHFREGRPDKGQYRRFKIRSFEGNDDFRAMEEVVGRRYGRLAKEGKPFPDLVVIDGGLGQVHAALKAFMILDVEPPPLIGLAKKLETVVFADGRPDLNLSHHDDALRLLQRLRDEAHRFANSFNAELRSRKLRESILDDFAGLGPKRRELILEHFGSIEKLKAAEPEDIEKVDGFGAVMAEKLYQFLKGV